MSQKTLNLCLERYNFVKFGETTKSSHTVLCINNAYSVNSDKYRLTPAAIASKHGEGYVFTLNYDFDRPLFTIVQKSYSLDGTSGNIVFEGIDPISKGGSKYLRKVTVSPVKLSDGSYLLEVTNDEYLRIGTTGAALGDEELESLNEKIVATGGIEKSVETVGGKQVLKLDASGSAGAKEIVYFDVDPSDPPSGIYEAIGEALSNNKIPVIKIDGAVYFYTATGTDKYVFVGGYTKEAVGYTEIEVSDDDSVASKSVDDKVFNMYLLYKTDPASPGDPPGTEDYWICDENKHVITKAELLAAHADCRYFILNNAVEPDSNSRKYFASVTVISNSYVRLQFYMMQYDDQGAAEFYQKTVSYDSEGRLYISDSYSATLAGTIQAVLVSEPQSFDSTQKAQGRDNIGAASASDVTALQSQVSSLSDVSAYTVKGEATVAQLNAGPSGIQAGWVYQLTDSGTLTDGTLAVVAGDTVAWDGTKWFPLVKSDYYATKTYAQNVAASIAPPFDPTRTSENPYKAGETVLYTNGRCYTFRKDHYGPWNVYDVEEADVASYLPLAVSASAQLLHGFINGFGFVTSGGVGATVDKYTTESPSVKSMEIQCVVGDKFVIYGTGGENYRLYSFLDDERKIISVATMNKDASDGLLLVAPENTASIVVNIVGDGSLYGLSKESDKNANNKFVNDAAMLTKTSMKNVTAGGYISTNGNHGDVVNLTPSTNANYVHQVIPVKQGDRFFVYGACGAVARLWCFVDGENKIMANYRGGQLDNLTESEIDAPCDGKLIVNFNKSTYEYDILGLDASKASAIVLEAINDVEKNCYIYDEQCTYNGYIETNVGIGNTVSYDVVYSVTYTYAVIACNKGDSFFIKGTGGISYRLWCFVDNSDKVITVANIKVATGDTGLYLTAPADGKFIYNSNKSVTHIVAKRVPLKEHVVRKLDFLLTDTPVKKDIIDYSMASRGRIVTNVGIGNVVSYDVVADYQMVNVVRACSKNDEFYIRGKGGATSRLWCFVDSNDKVVDAAISSLTVLDELKLVAPCDGKFIFNSNVSGDPYCKIWWNTNSYVDGRFASIEDNVRELQNSVIEFDDTPYSDITNYSADITNFAMTNMMELVNTKFDTLVSEYSSLITKYDAAELVDMEYPRYANGVPAGDPDYRETPAYRLYIYKISDINANVGNTGKWPKKKLFIIGAIHGYEELAGFNLFAYASHILRKPGKDLFALLAKFDIWIMPFVNGYGILHGGRTNGNGVDINRNFGTTGWTVHGELGDNDYSGQTPDSEFETQLLEALYGYIQPDFYVDHHCTPHYSSSQIYSITRSEKIWNQSYMALVELSRGLIKFKPAYFGTKYHLFDDSGLYGTLPKSVSMSSDSMGRSQSWFYEHGVESLTLEIMAYINYLNGEVSDQVPFGNDVFVVNEMSLRCQLDYYLRAVMG